MSLNIKHFLKITNPFKWKLSKGIMQHILNGREISERNSHDELARISTHPDVHLLIRENIALTQVHIPTQLTADTTLVYAVHASDEYIAMIQTLTQRLSSILSIAYPHIVRTAMVTECIATAQTLPPIMNRMGRALTNHEQEIVKGIATSITTLLHVHQSITKNINALSESLMPNTTRILGALLAARLLVESGSFKRLASSSASTIQMLGARKAVLRAMASSAKSPKHGIIFNHPYVRTSKTPGKNARVLADKIAISARVDYFKGKPVAEHILKQLAFLNEQHASRIP